ncbi:MAG: hypothetical protein IJD96_06250 [Lachnospiraceae bacterium]|nr:hypothetical protein [Lachnospiraceae bacterium]
MKTKKNRRSFIVTLTMALLMAAMLIGCSSSAETVKETKTAEEATVKEEATKVAEGERIEETTSKSTSEPTPKPTPKPTPEPIVYEGIDMESTLPGEEWILTFVGIINEPKFVVFNDETNKKVIVEEKGKVTLDKGDVFAIYLPNVEKILESNGIKRKEVINKEYYEMTYFDEEYFTKKTDYMVKLNDGNQMNCTITPNFD